MLIKLWEFSKENFKEKVFSKFWRLKVIMKNLLKEKKEKDKKISKDQKKFKEWETISNFAFLKKHKV